LPAYFHLGFGIGSGAGLSPLWSSSDIEFLYSQGDFPRPFCFRKNSANAKTRFAVDFSGPNVLDTIAQPQQNESHNLFFRFRLSVAVGFVVSAQSSAQSLFGSALHAPIWKGNRSDSCGESNLN
jgi:hypothetical protein